MTASVYDGTDINTSGSYSLTQTDGVGDWNYVSTPEGFQGTLASDPAIYGHGGTASSYPIVAVLYAVPWSNYGSGNLPTAYGSNQTDIGNTVKSFVSYTVKTGAGKLVAAKVGYQKLPSSIQTTAKLVAGDITP